VLARAYFSSMFVVGRKYILEVKWNNMLNLSSPLSKPHSPVAIEVTDAIENNLEAT
jgi:hypothetical protein